MIKAVVFDLDGLLVDTEPLWYRARTELFQRYDLVWNDSDQKRCMGVSTADWSNYMAERLNMKLSPAEIVDEILGRLEAYYQAGEVELLPGVSQALEFSLDNYKLGLASGSPGRLVNAALQGANWGNLFSEVLSGDDLPAGKPAPDIYLEITRRLRVSVRETVVVEDSTSGILAGYAAGAKVIAVPNQHLKPPPDVLNKADVVIDSLLSFNSALNQLLE